MNFSAHGLRLFFNPRQPAARLFIITGLAWLSTIYAADTPATADAAAPAASAPASLTKIIKQPSFTLEYPAGWLEDKTAPDYNADTNFTLKSPDPKNTYIQFNIVDKAEDVDKVLKATLVSLDGPAITALSKSKIEKWGNYSGSGMHLKGKILDTIPGGIKVFIFNSGKHNVLVVEYYYAQELKDLQADLEYISLNFKMLN